MAEPDIETLRLVHTEVKERAARLDAAGARLDTKAAVLLPFISAVCIYLAAQNVSGWWKAAAFVAWGAAITSGLLTMRVRRWQETPEPEPLQKLISPRSEAAALTLLTAAQVKAFAANREIHERKALYWRVAGICLAVAVLLTAAALTLGGNRSADRPASPRPSASATAAGPGAVR